MNYGPNILHNEAAYYELNNASITNGILTIFAGGYARCNIDKTQLSVLTEYMKVNLRPLWFTNNYIPLTQVNIFVTTADMQYNYTIFPTIDASGICMQEIQLEVGEYVSLIFEVRAKENISFSLWELCPEAADEDIQTIIDGVTQSLPRLVFDYNTWPLSIEQSEMTIALITFRLLDNTDLQGHFQMSYTASEECTLVLRFKDNTATELFAPLTYDLNAGRGSVGVPHAYLDRLRGVHTCIVTAQVTSGSLYVDTRGILFTIDGGYLAERMLDIGVDMRDISIRQLTEDYGPDEIWIIGIEAGEAIVRKREYSETSTITFEPQFSLGQAIDAAIEFNGTWFLRDGQENYTLITEELPWVFWIDPTYTLYAQIGNLEETRVILDIDVSSLSVVRGFNSQVTPEQDQGLICAYVKNNQACYIQYAYSTGDISYKWRDIYTLDITETVQSIHVHRLNDYRIGIAITTNNSNYWYITERTFVGQATPPENLFVLLENIFILPKMMPYDYTVTDFNVTTEFICMGDWRDTAEISLVATFSHDIRCVSENVKDCFIFTPDQIEYEIRTINVEKRKITFNLIGPVLGSISIIPDSSVLQYYEPNVGYYTIPREPWIFTPYDTASYMNLNISNFKVVASVRSFETQQIATPEEFLNTSISNFNVIANVKAVKESYLETEAESLSVAISNFNISATVSYVGEQPI